MSIITIGQPDYSLFSQTGIDTDSNTISNEFEIGGYSAVSFEVQSQSGSHSTHIVTMQCTLDGTNWADTSETITGIGMKEVPFTGAYRIRFKVTTVEGSDSIVNINGIAKER